MSMSEPLMPSPRRDERGGPSAEDVDLEVVTDEQGGDDPAGDDASQDDVSTDETSQGGAGSPAATGDSSFRTPHAGDSLSPEELRRES